MLRPEYHYVLYRESSCRILSVHAYYGIPVLIIFLSLLSCAKRWWRPKSLYYFLSVVRPFPGCLYEIGFGLLEGWPLLLLLQDKRWNCIIILYFWTNRISQLGSLPFSWLSADCDSLKNLNVFFLQTVTGLHARLMFTRQRLKAWYMTIFSWCRLLCQLFSVQSSVKGMKSSDNCFCTLISGSLMLAVMCPTIKSQYVFFCFELVKTATFLFSITCYVCDFSDIFSLLLENCFLLGCHQTIYIMLII